MWDSVRDNFFGFSAPLEGVVAYMYQDILGKVTIGVGNLIDSEAAALALPAQGAPFFHKEPPGTPLTTVASDAEISAEWHMIKGDASLAAAGHTAAGAIANLRLRDDGIDAIVRAKVLQMESYLTDGHVAEFANFQSWPADAQLALLSMSWAMGSAFADGTKWPSFRSNCAAGDWLAAAKNCNMSNQWLAKRNAVNRGLFRNAAYSVAPPPSPAEDLALPIPGNRPRLQLGDQDGADTSVATLQSFLTWMGYPCTENGTFDQETDTAVRAFQTDEAALPGATGFSADGVVGPLTWAALGYLVPTA